MILWLILLLPSVFSSNVFHGRRRTRLDNRLSHKVELDPSILATSGHGWVTQRVDHFDGTNAKTWKQRFFYNTEYQKADSNVNLLYISGEEMASGSLVYGGAQVDYAMKLNAPIYALEHRFYGESIPTEDASLENLKYLSTQQVIEDIADFIRQMNEDKGEGQQWIVIGESYPANLAAWSRLKHPELISGALASSAPILAMMDFYGYLKIVEDDFKKIGGECFDLLSNGLNDAQKLLQSAEGRDKLSKTLKIVPPLSDYDDITDNDRDQLFGQLTLAFELSVQFNEPKPSELCQTLTSFGANIDPIEALGKLIRTPFSVNFTEMVDELRTTRFDDPNVESRLWVYQTCREFGYIQTTNMGSNVFGQTESSNSDIDMCIELFGIDADQIRKNVDATNGYYGGRDYFAGTNVVFTRGTQDPWGFLAKNSDPKHWSVVLVEIEGGSHGSDLKFSCFTEACDDKMKKVQQLILENMQRWVDPLFPVPDSVEITDNVGKRPQIFNSTVPIPSLYSQSNVIRAKRSESPSKHRVNFEKWNKLTGGRRNVLLSSSVSEMPEDQRDDGQDWIDQTFDHFNTNEERTFKQKWYYNYKFGSENGPNFLLIGWEGPENIKYVQNENLAWMTYAKEVGANLFILEHRYYGESKLGTNDLQFLTSSQMLYDVATFIRTQQVKFNRTGPWITFGGSYPGALAAWSRQWFPELIIGSVASSGPVQAKNNYYEYMEVVEDVVRRTSQKCYDGTAEAFDRLRVLSQNPDGRMIIQDKFKLWPGWTADEPVDALDLNEVFMNLYSVYQGIVQYNPAYQQAMKALCSFMEDDKYDDKLDALRALQKGMNGGDDVATLSSYDADIKSMIDMKSFVDGHDPTAYTDVELVGILWTWQTCNEFGYFQTTDYGQGIFGSHLPINFFIIMCERVFGVGMDDIEKAISRANYQYGGRDRFNTTNVVLPNGDGDPWHALGILEQGNMDESVVPIVIPGTSHCMDQFAATANDPPELTQARKTILDNIKKWLAPTVVSTTVQPIKTTVGKTEQTSSVTETTIITTTTSPTTTSITRDHFTLSLTFIMLCITFLI
ncbi:hypothetical protein PRIPAC_77540 [Pristionchus pacificus]|nr:hypothetical protein PRIPAC_77540 [Pristionchus pacificus]